MNIYGFVNNWQARLRYIKEKELKDRKFILFADPHWHVFVHDFINLTISLPDWFDELNLERDCFEAPLPDSPPGSLTPPSVYAKLIEYFRQFYNIEKAIEIWPPRGCDHSSWHLPMMFCRYTSTPITKEKPIVSVFPRARARAAQRNVPEYIWKELVDKLKENYIVVLGGTPDGACLSDYEDENIINLIKYNEEDKTEKIMEYLYNSKFSVSSQSGPTHMSLLCDTPSVIIGHEKQRHAVDVNRFDTPVSFREVMDYRAIDADTILNDIKILLEKIDEVGWVKDISFDDLSKIEKNDLNMLIKDRIGIIENG